MADAAFFQGYMDEQQRLHASTLQLETVQLIAVGERKQRCSFCNAGAAAGDSAFFSFISFW